MEYSWKRRKDRNRRQEQNKKEWASSAGLCQKTQTETSPPREGEWAGAYIEVARYRHQGEEKAALSLSVTRLN